MKLILWLSAVAWACAASGCGTSMSPPSTDPSGFTFNTAEGSFASFGWSGNVHHVEAPVETPFEVKTTRCQDDVCRFEGPADSGAKVNRRRCLFQMSRSCTIDSDCPTDNGKVTSCVYIYDSPIATPLPGLDNHIGACAWTYIPLATPDGKPTIAGTLNLATGALKLENFTVLLPLNANGMNTFAGVCAECVGDKTANDGAKDGTCKLATHLGAPAGPNGEVPLADHSVDLGMPCDVNRTGTIGGYDGSYSMDCSPTVVSGLGAPLAFGGSFSSSGVQVALTDQSPDCTAPGFLGKKCLCGMCKGEKAACMSNADCAGGGPCMAESMPEDEENQDNVRVAGNPCDNGICTNWDANEGAGTCVDSMLATQEMPHPVVGCYPSPTTGFAGSDNKPISIVAPGFAEPDPQLSTLYHANTAGARCIPAGGSARINRQLGLPGLLFQKRNFQITLHYAEVQR